VITESKNSWYFSNHALHEGRTFSIDWSTFHFELIEKKHDRHIFISSAKEFLRAVIKQLPSIAAQSSPGSMANFGRLLRRLIRWMIEKEIYRFSFLEEDHMVAFVESRFEANGKPLTDKSLRTYILLFERLWDLRFQYKAALKKDPYKIQKLYLLQRSSQPTARWDPIPLEAAVPLLRDAIEWIDNEAQILLKVIHEHNLLRGNLRGVTKAEMRRKSCEAYKSLSNSSTDFKALQQSLAGSIDNDDVKEAIRCCSHLSYGAAITIILFFSGIRCSELLSLRLGCNTRRMHGDGTKYWYIEGVAAKKGGHAKAWVVPEPVITAIRFLEDLHSLTVGDLENDYLFAIPNGNGVLPPPYVSVRRLWPSTVATFLRMFARSRAREMPTNKDVRLHPHQARKTFARFVVIRDKRGLEALAQHYGHLYTALLDRMYVGSDIDLYDLVDRESERDLEEGLTDLLKSNSLGGSAGNMLAEIRREAQLRYRGKTALTSLVKQLIREGVTLAPCDWGYCVYAQDQSACGGDNRGPNQVNREPGTCSTCGNFAVTEKHRGWWEARVKREQLFLQQPNLSAQTIEVVRSRLKKSEEVLISLNRSMTSRSSSSVKN
jgi:integrase